MIRLLFTITLTIALCTTATYSQTESDVIHDKPKVLLSVQEKEDGNRQLLFTPDRHAKYRVDIADPHGLRLTTLMPLREVGGQSEVLLPLDPRTFTMHGHYYFLVYDERDKLVASRAMMEDKKNYTKSMPRR